MDNLLEKISQCQTCAVFPKCFTIGLTNEELTNLEQQLIKHQTLHKGENIFNTCDIFNGIYIVRAGSFKLIEIGRASCRERV